MMIRKLLVAKIVRDNPGYSAAHVDEAITVAMDGRPFFDWLMSGGGLEKIIQLVLIILQLLLEKPE